MIPNIDSASFSILFRYFHLLFNTFDLSESQQPKSANLWNATGKSFKNNFSIGMLITKFNNGEQLNLQFTNKQNPTIIHWLNKDCWLK